MSRLPLRELFRLARSGLEKVALACAAFGLLYTTARAGESAPAGVALDDQWSAGAAPQLATDDAWSNPAASTLETDDAWSAPAADRFTSTAQTYDALPPHVLTEEPQPAAMKSEPRALTTTDQETSPTLAMDNADWNETPRGRSPGLIAAHDAWLKRTKATAEPSEPAKAPVHVAPAQPVDPWSAPLNGLVTSNDVATPARVVAPAVFEATPHPNFMVTPHAGAPRINDAPGVSRADASPKVLAAGRTMRQHTRPIVHKSPSSSRSCGTRRAKVARAPSRAWCRAVSASARYR
jgi:hypothetical protein